MRCVGQGEGRSCGGSQQRVSTPHHRLPQVKSQSSLEDDMSGRKVLAIADAKEESMRPSDAIDCQSKLKGGTYSR